MPHKYEVMRDKFMQQGLSPKRAKTKAAKIFNAQRKPGEAPVTGKSPTDMGLADAAGEEPSQRDQSETTRRMD